MTWFLAIVALLSLVVLGVWLPLLWIGAAVIFALIVVHPIGMSRRGLSQGGPGAEGRSRSSA
jgi:hypothetical protein